MPYRVKEVANMVGVSVRTLHHYDQIGLLRPATGCIQMKTLKEYSRFYFLKNLNLASKRLKTLLTVLTLIESML